ncbi:MAG: DctP family TRAP transporter solute-binding subunit [Arenicella sp.]
MTLLKTISFISLIISSLTSIVWAQTSIIRVAYDAAANSPHGPMVKQFEHLIDQEFKGSIKIQLYPYNGQLNEGNILPELSKGNLDLAIPSLSNLSSYSQRFKMFDLPFLFYSQAAAERFLNGEYGARLANSLWGKGYKGLGFLNNGMKQLAANKKILRPYDAVGLKVGIMDSEVLVQQYEQMGARSIVAHQDDIASLLETQKLDSHENNWLNIQDNELHKQQPFIMESNHGYQGFLVVMSREFWSALSQDVQPELQAILREAIRYGNRAVNKKMEEARQHIMASGVTQVYRLTAEERQGWAESLQIVWEIFEDDIGTELIKVAASER